MRSKKLIWVVHPSTSYNYLMIYVMVNQVRNVMVNQFRKVIVCKAYGENRQTKPDISTCAIDSFFYFTLVVNQLLLRRSHGFFRNWVKKKHYQILFDMSSTLNWIPRSNIIKIRLQQNDTQRVRQSSSNRRLYISHSHITTLTNEKRKCEYTMYEYVH